MFYDLSRISKELNGTIVLIDKNTCFDSANCIL